MLVLLVAAGGFLLLSAHVAEWTRPLLPSQARLATMLTREVRLPLHVEHARLDPWRLALALENVRVEIDSWTLEVPRLLLRPSARALLGGRLEPAASANGFVLSVAAEDGASAARRIPELLEVVGLPDGRIRLAGGQLRSQRGELLLRAIRFGLDVAEAQTRLEVRARQRTGGRLDAHGTIGSDGAIRLYTYLDELSTPALQPWLQLVADPARAGLALPPLHAVASGRWHLRVAAHGGAQHEFGLDLRASEDDDLRAELRLAGRLELTPDGEGSGARILPGASVRVRGRAERLRVVSVEGQRASRLSGPFEIQLLPFGPLRQPQLVAEASFDEASLSLPIGLRKRAGTRGRLGLALPGAGSPGRFSIALGALDASGTLERDGTLHASAGWMSLPSLARLVPDLAHRASGGRLRVTRLEARAPSDFEAWLEFEGAELAGRKMPFAVRALQGRARLTAERFEAQDLLAELGGAPVRFDFAAARSLGEPGGPVRIRFQARTQRLVLGGSTPLAAAAGEAPPSLLALPPALQRTVEQQLARLRNLALEHPVEIESGVFRCAQLQAGSESLRDLEIELRLHALQLALPHAAFLLRGRQHSYRGSIDLNPILPDVQLASLR